jgi:hypothetical protein
MKTCAACGYENDEDAEFCAKCGAALEAEKPKVVVEKEDYGCFGDERKEDECFGLPYGGAICGIIIGLFIILWALGTLFQWPIWNYFWIILILIVGVLIVAGALYTISRSRRA